MIFFIAAYRKVNQGQKFEKIMALLTDRAQGMTALEDNEMEVMIHRRMFVDDHYGVGEALDEHAFGKPLVVRGRHLVYAAEPIPGANTDVWRRYTAVWNYMPPMLMFQTTDLDLNTWVSLDFGIKDASFVKADEPAKIPFGFNLMTLERWDSGEDNP